MKKRIILSAGGTGGHLFPAQALAEQLSDYELLFVAGGLKSCRYFERSRYAHREISSATFSFSKPFQLIRAAWKIARGLFQSFKILRRYKPDLVIGFGSFYTLPLLLAARLKGIPLILHEQNAIPGKVNRLFSRYASTTAITFPQAKEFLKGASVEVAFPIRREESCSDPWAYFGLKKEQPILLIFGGSQGAVRLNSLALECAADWHQWQILHLAGNEKEAERMEAGYTALGIVHCVKPFEAHIDRALKVADLAITRAGAGTINDLITHALPAVLVPYPFASEEHQNANAVHFAHEVGGGLLHLESALDRVTLKRAVAELEKTLEKKSEKIQDYRSKHPLPHFEELVRGVIDE